MNEPFNLSAINQRSALLPAPQWTFYFNIVELIAITVGLAWSLLCGRIIYKRPLFHTNLMRLVSSLYVGVLLLELMRLGICIGAFKDPEVLQNRSIFLTKMPFMWLEVGRLCSGYSALLGILCVIVERMLATRLVGFYEQKKPSRIIFLLIAVTWMLTPFAAFCLYYSLLTLSVAIMFAVLVIMFVFVAYQYMKWVNYRRLIEAQKPKANYKLAERYQLQENIRVLKILKRCTLMLFYFVPLIVFIVIMIVLAQQNEVRDWIFYARSSVNTVACVCPALFLWAAVTGTHVWRSALEQQLQGLFHFHRCCKRVDVIKAEFPKGIDGQQLAFESSQAREIYFQNLKQAWS